MAFSLGDVAARPPVSLPGGRVMQVFSATCDTDYATNGYALSAADLGLAAIELVLPHPASGFVFEYDYTGHKLKAFMGDNNNSADGPLIEVTTGLDGLAGVVTRLLVIGTPA